MSRILVPVILGAILFSTGASGASAPRESWGKADVSLDQYREDAVLCGRQAYYLDVSNTPAAKALVRASSQIENLPSNINENNFQPVSGAEAITMAVQGARPEQRFREIAALQKSTLENCLTSLGYVRFRLTEAQRDHLSKLRGGSPERHAYLHSLASDPKILSAQRG